MKLTRYEVLTTLPERWLRALDGLLILIAALSGHEVTFSVVRPWKEPPDGTEVGDDQQRSGSRPLDNQP
jgi:hypothetical protein